MNMEDVFIAIAFEKIIRIFRYFYDEKLISRTDLYPLFVKLEDNDSKKLFFKQWLYFNERKREV